MKLFSLILTCLLSWSALADSITVNTNSYYTTTLTAGYRVNATNSVFTYYGWPATNVGVTAVTVTGFSTRAHFPPVQGVFDFTGSSLELVVNCYDYTSNSWSGSGCVQLSDGQTTTSCTNWPSILPGNTYYIPVRFSSNTLHHLALSVSGTFFGVNVTGGNTVSTRAMPKQNLLIVEGDSYTQGYHQDPGYHYWFDGWVWQLARLVPNTQAVPSGVGGTGFVVTGYGPVYGDRVVSDICALYTNAVASGKYDQIFITASGTINDGGMDTNLLFSAVTNVYSIIKTACSGANIFVVGNWQSPFGATSPSAGDYANNIVMSNAAVALNLPYFSPVQAALIHDKTSYGEFFPAGTDNIHPSQYGYSVMANFISTNLENAYGASWTAAEIAGESNTNNTTGGSNTSNTTGGSNTNSTSFSLSVADYGAQGDAVQLYVDTVSNSFVVTTTNQLSNADIGKVIEVFRVGTWQYGPNENGIWTNDCDDLITTITNVVNGTNIYLAQPCLRSWTNTFATFGTDNSPAFADAIAAASGYTNITVNIPAGKFLLMPSFHAMTNSFGSKTDITYSSIYLNGGGIHFVGAGSANTTLLENGAWRNLTNSQGSSGVCRGTLVEVASLYHFPFTNDYPISFSDLTMDGGVQQGRTPVTGYPANNITGNGWGGCHNAYQLVGADNPSGRVSEQILSNVCFVHWRAEMVISTDQYKNGKMLIKKCTFSDGNATALNIYPTLDVDGCTFSIMNQVAELYQYWTSGTTNYFRNNYITNLTGNGFAWNGGTGTNSDYYFQSNTAYYNKAGDFLLTTPGDNIHIIGNTVTLQSSDATFLCVGSAGYQGYFCNSNIVVMGNTVTALGNADVFVQIGGGSPNNSDTVTICSNNISGFQYALYAYDTYTNVQLYGNNMGTVALGTPAAISPFVLIQTNNTWVGPTYNNESASTNIISYGSFPKVTLKYVSAVHALQLEDSTRARIPQGAVIVIDNSQNQLGADIRVLPSQLSFDCVTITNGTVGTFYWTQGVWSTTRTFTLSPPGNLRVQ